MRAVCHVHGYPPYHLAGSETTMHVLLRELVKSGWEVDVCLTEEQFSADEFYELDGVRVHPWGGDDQLLDYVRGADLLFTHLMGATRSAAVRQVYGIPLVNVVHNSLAHTAGWLSQGVDLAVYNSQWVADIQEGYKSAAFLPFAESPFEISLARRGRCDDWDSVIVRPIVDPEEYAISTSREYITLVNLWDGDGKTMSKGPHTFYHLAYRFPQYKFLGLAGGYGEQVIKDLPNVTIVENTPRIKEEVYARTKIVLMPSLYESYGRVTVEAAASGIPSILSPTPGLKEAMGDAALYAEPSDYAMWGKHLSHLMTPRGYNRYSKLASERSSLLYERSKEELETFIDKCNHLARR